MRIVDYAYQDSLTGLPVTVSGGAVVWHDVIGYHTVTASDGSFDSGLLAPGEVFSVSLRLGTYEYACQLHPFMRGTLVVR